MKVCTKCNQQKDESEYFFQDKKTARLHAECKHCYKAHRKTYAAAHYQKYGDLYRRRAKIRKAEVKKELQTRMLEYLANKACEICGESDTCVLDFDHLDPTSKAFGISNGITNGLGWDLILNEIAKCMVLCANCHRRRTAVQQGWYRVSR